MSPPRPDRTTRLLPVWLWVLVVALPIGQGVLFGAIGYRGLSAPLSALVGAALGLLVALAIAVRWKARSSLKPGPNSLARPAVPNTLWTPGDDDRPGADDEVLAGSSSAAPGVGERLVQPALATGVVTERASATGIGTQEAAETASAAPWADWNPRPQAAPRQPRGRALAVVLSMTVVAIVAVLSGRGNAAPTAATQSWASLSVGDCFDSGDVSGSTVGALPSSGGPASLPEISLVPCTGAHTFEVFGLASDPTTPGAAYPGDQVEYDRSNTACTQPFKTYVGIDYEAARLHARISTPSAQTWAVGDRRIVCALYDPNQSRLTGSQKGSFTPYTSATFGYSLSIPVGWTAGPRPGDATGTLMRGPDASIVVGVDPVGSASTEQLAAAVGSDLTDNGASSLKSGSLTIGDVDWSVIQYVRPVAAGSTLGIDAVAVHAGKSNLLIWSSAAGNEDADFARFMEILGSFQPAS